MSLRSGKEFNEKYIPFQHCDVCGKLVRNANICSLKCLKEKNEILEAQARGKDLSEDTFEELMGKLSELTDQVDTHVYGNNYEEIKDMPEDDPRTDR